MSGGPISSPALAGVLEGLRVLDFSTLLPGPLCTLMLAACGANVIKVERPGQGDEMRLYGPRHQGRSLSFALLNAGKRSVALDLRQPRGKAAALELISEADVLVEQFRPGVMARLGLDYETLRVAHPNLIYCSITGYGQNSPLAQVAGHDLNYAAKTGLLMLGARPGEKPALPHVPLADVAAGSYPAVLNILLALRRRERGEGGLHLDIDMSAGLLPLMYGAFAAAQVPGFEEASVFGGGSPRYAVYRTADCRFLAVAAAEDRFWQRFCELAGLPLDADHDTVACAVGARTAAEWEQQLDGEDVCCTVVQTVADYLAGPEYAGTEKQVRWGGNDQTSALPLPLHPALRSARIVEDSPYAPATEISW